MAYDKTEPIGGASSQQSPGGMFGAPPPQQPTTWARAARLIGAAMPATIALTVAVVVVNALLPQPVKLTTLMGKFMAELHITETVTQQDTVVENSRRMADAQAAANARWQMEVIAFQQQQQALMDAMQAKIAMVNAADLTCTLGPLGVALFFGQGSGDARNAAQIVQAACVYAARTRQEIAAEQGEIARLNSAIMQRQTMAGVR
jgi:hypothetical protein